VLERTIPADFVAMEIGGIGSIAAAEQSALRVALKASGLDPATTRFSAVGLPERAVLDADTGLLQWAPGSTDAGLHGNIDLIATDATDSVVETITIAVAETSLTLAGRTLAQIDSTPIAGVSVGLRGTKHERPLSFSDASGNYRFSGLEAGRRYRVRLDKPSKKLFRATPKSIKIEIPPTDPPPQDILLIPK
jgi:hypothetical protein